MKNTQPKISTAEWFQWDHFANATKSTAAKAFYES